MAAFYDAVQRDIKLFAFILLTLCVYRAYFMFYMAGYLSPSAGADDVLLALLTGLRLSLKTAGAVTLPAFVLCSLPLLALPRLAPVLRRLRFCWGGLAAFAFAVLFQARFPFYRQFQTSFNMQVAAGLNDDAAVLAEMMLREYGLLWRLCIALLLTAVSLYVLRSLLLVRRTYALPALRSGVQRAVFSLGLLFLFAAAFVFVRFGGSFTYAGGVNWENAGVTSDAFLNECILDDGQALYRVRSMHKRLKSGDIVGVDKEHVRALAVEAAGHAELSADTLTPYLTRTAQGASIPKPRHIFIVLGETYAQWPMLETYAALHAADGIKGLIREPNAYYSRRFMPNGDFTSIAITGLVTGLSEVNQHVNYVARSLREAYPTAMAPQFKRLGYAVDFWYGGVPSWEGMDRFSTAQGFDHFLWVSGLPCGKGECVGNLGRAALLCAVSASCR